MTDKAGFWSTRKIVVIFLLSGAAIVLFALGPLLLALSAGLIAQTAGCTLDEGSVHACLIGGVELGETLYTMFVLGWLTMMTAPLGAIAGLVWLIALAGVVILRLIRKKT
ncbi:hypothetical protein [Rhizobium sp. FKL33]|uniref:hypothetical protein n=1 Tax=Rhizobium sp. FKL33 TaxID=2562307 RepID=UPI0010C123A3|nr:hypothetical protein [Rhizobium sp. FKL33]